MSSSNALEKGNALEEAVRLIEETILRTNPGTKGATITIEPKKIVTVDDVKHEIDIFITIDHGKGYKSIFIFECKNWEDAVGKNEIVNFTEKIKVVQATKGFFIAKSFTQYAVAQAKLDRRIELLEASTELDILPPFLENFHYVRDTFKDTNFHIKMRVQDPSVLHGLTIKGDTKMKFRGQDISFEEFSQQIGTNVKEEVMNHEPTGTFSNGVYQYDRNKTFTFQPGELLVGEFECAEVDAHVSWESMVIRPRIVSQFDIKERGRVITFESDQFPEGSVRVSFAETI